MGVIINKGQAVQVQVTISIEEELLNTLRVIDNNLKQVTSDEEHAILLNARVNALMSLQKYE